MNIGFLEILRSSGSLKIKIIKLIDYFLGSFITSLLPPRNPLPSSVYENKWKRILIIRPGGIGDAIFLLPILNAMKKLDSSPLITDILCERRNSWVFVSQKGTHDHLYFYDDVRSFFSIFQNRYDVIIDTEQWHYLSAITAYFLKPSVTIGFASRRLRAKLFNQKISYDLNGYELENFKKLFSTDFPELTEILNLENSFKVSPKTFDWAHSQIPSSSVSLYLGGSLPEKRLTLSQISSIVQFILEQGFTPILLGGGDFLDENLQIEKNISQKNLINLTAKTSLEESAAVIQQSKLFIGTDSGLMHLACAVGTPVIAIFGSSNLQKWGPQGSQHTVITENVECAPCSLFGYSLPTCHGSYHCLKKMDIDRIKMIIKRSLEMYSSKKKE